MAAIDFVNIIVAALAAWFIGAVYYVILSESWMKAAGLTKSDIQSRSKTPFAISLVVLMLIAGLMRHLLADMGVTSIGGSVLYCVQIGFFVAGGWILINNAYEGKPHSLSLINIGYAVLATATIGLVLALF